MEDKSKYISQLRKNTVSAHGQLKESQFVSFENAENIGKHIMFVGNSITRHGKAPQIGWNNDWGMAASAKEKDYAHILIKKIKEKYPDAVFCICQVAEWEKNYKTGADTFDLYRSARDFKADMIIMRFVENCPYDDFDEAAFTAAYRSLLEYLDPSGKAQIIMTTGFWRHPGDAAIKKIAEEKNFPCADLGVIGDDDSMKAIGLFKHGGVAIHPCDKGMAAIADSIYKLFPENY